MKILAVYDLAIQAFGQLIQTRATGEAIRSFTDEANREDSEINKHPEDYELFELGEYDQTTGEIRTYITRLIKATDVKNTA